MNHTNNETGGAKISRVVYPEGMEFIRVIFYPNGAMDMRAALDPCGGTEVVGEPLDTSAIEIARLMNHAYRLGRSNYIERCKARDRDSAGGPDVVLEDILDAELIELIGE